MPKNLPRQQNMRTPPWLFEKLDLWFGPFKLDAASSHENALCSYHYTEKENGLVQPWRDRTFYNPPWGQFRGWIAAAIRQWELYRKRSVEIGPAGGNQLWFYEIGSRQAVHCITLHPRVQYLNPDGSPAKGAMWDTMVYLVGYDAPDLSPLDFVRFDVRGFKWR